MASEVIQSQGIYKVWAWFETNKKPVVGGVAAAIVIGLIVWFVIWQRDQKLANASQELSKVFTAEMATSGRAENPDSYLKLAAKYPNTPAGARASLLAAGTLFAQGKYTEAQSQFEKFVRDHRDSPLVAEAQLGSAACLDAQGKSDQAVTAYKQLIERHPSENVVPQAKFSLARIYEAQNKPDQAYKLYEDVGRDPYGSLGSEAGMRLEELKLKYPNLAASSAPVTAIKPASPVKLPGSNMAPATTQPATKK